MPADPLALYRRRQAAYRSEPRPCGCRDPWGCAHGRAALDDVELDGWEAACAQLAGLGLPPLVPAHIRAALRLRATRRRLLELAAT